MSDKKWRVARASVAGQSHIDSNTECQDRLACQTIDSKEGEILIAAVADGAGSTSEGQRGAEIACDFFVEQITAFLDSGNATLSSLSEEFGKHWIKHFQETVEEIAKKSKKEIREFSTTLVAAVVGEKAAVFFQVGDGGAVFSASGASQSYKFGVEPVDAEYINMTDFLTDDEAVENLRFAVIEESVEDLILFSDGIYAVAVNYQENKPHEPFLMPMIAPLRNGSEVNGLNEKLEKFLASPKLNEKTDDDKTIILASRHIKDE